MPGPVFLAYDSDKTAQLGQRLGKPPWSKVQGSVPQGDWQPLSKIHVSTTPLAEQAVFL